MDVLKRFPIKYVRDYIKKDYKIRDKCFICGSKDNLELHHLYSLSQLWEAWCREHNLKKMLDKKLMVMVNSDDPAYFGGYLNQNLIETSRNNFLFFLHPLSLTHLQKQLLTLNKPIGR